MADEQSILEQIKAIEAWAIQAKQKVDSRKFDDAGKLCKTIEVQGRRLEWRSGESGLKHLPELEEVKTLRLKVSEARAAVQQSISAVTSLAKLAKKEGKKPAEVAAIKRDEVRYLNNTGKSIIICIQLLKEARAIASAEPWVNPELYIKTENRKVLLALLRKDGFFKSMDAQKRRELVKRINIRRVSLKRVNLIGADLSWLILDGADLEGAELKDANLNGTHLYRANLAIANLVDASLERAFISETNFFRANLVRANLKQVHADDINFTNADLRSANLNEGLLNRANFNGARLGNSTLQKADLESALFTNASLEYADLSQASVKEAIFTGAYLKGAKFIKSFMWGVTLHNANVEGTDFDKALGLNRTQFNLTKNPTKAKNVEFNRQNNF